MIPPCCKHSVAGYSAQMRRMGAAILNEVVIEEAGYTYSIRAEKKLGFSRLRLPKYSRWGRNKAVDCDKCLPVPPPAAPASCIYVAASLQLSAPDSNANLSGTFLSRDRERVHQQPFRSRKTGARITVTCITTFSTGLGAWHCTASSMIHTV